jgi:hypothetical protein
VLRLSLLAQAPPSSPAFCRSLLSDQSSRASASYLTPLLTPTAHLPTADCHRTERFRRRHFRRTFRLPHDVDPSGVTATIRDGVLIVRIAKLLRSGTGSFDAVAAGEPADTGTGALAAAAPDRRRVRVHRLPMAAVDPQEVADAAASDAVADAAAAAVAGVEATGTSSPAVAAVAAPAPAPADVGAGADAGASAAMEAAAQPGGTAGGTTPALPMSPASWSGGLPLSQTVQLSYSFYGMGKTTPAPPATPRQSQL